MMNGFSPAWQAVQVPPEPWKSSAPPAKSLSGTLSFTPIGKP